MRLFFPQSLIDRWVESGEATLRGDRLTRADRVYRLVSGVHFRGLDGGTADTSQLVGRVKDAGQLAALGVEVISESAVLGDAAYVVTPGYLGIAEGEGGTTSDNPVPPEPPPVTDEDAKLLSEFLLEKS